MGRATQPFKSQGKSFSRFKLIIALGKKVHPSIIMVFSTRQRLIFQCSARRTLLCIYDDEETLNSFNEQTFNSLQRLLRSSSCVPKKRLWFPNFSFCVCSLMKSETCKIKSDFYRHEELEPKSAAWLQRKRDFRFRKPRKKMWNEDKKITGWCVQKLPCTESAKLVDFCQTAILSQVCCILFSTKSFSMLVSRIFCSLTRD